jgi:hypothetical protein
MLNEFYCHFEIVPLRPSARICSYRFDSLANHTAFEGATQGSQQFLMSLVIMNASSPLSVGELVLHWLELCARAWKCQVMPAALAVGANSKEKLMIFTCAVESFLSSVASSHH